MQRLRNNVAPRHYERTDTYIHSTHEGDGFRCRCAPFNVAPRRCDWVLVFTCSLLSFFRWCVTVCAVRSTYVCCSTTRGTHDIMSMLRKFVFIYTPGCKHQFYRAPFTIVSASSADREKNAGKSHPLLRSRPISHCLIHCSECTTAVSNRQRTTHPYLDGACSHHLCLPFASGSISGNLIKRVIRSEWFWSGY